MTESTQQAKVESQEKRKRSIFSRLRWGNLSYMTRLTLSFALISAMTALVAIGVLSVVWQTYFQDYTTNNIQTVANAAAESIAQQYKKDGDWTDDTALIAEYAAVMYKDVGIAVVAADGTVRYDSSQSPGNRDRASLLNTVGISKIATAPIVVDESAVGSVRVWVYGSSTLLRQSDINFRDNSYRAMAYATGFAILLSLIIGFLFARNLVRPIKRMTSTAEAIKEGNLSARTDIHGEDEISQLCETFDTMAESVERERDAERRLTADVAHELRTPLMAIQAQVEGMIDGVLAPSQERLETVNNEVMRLSRMVNALLKLSRLENRKTPLNMELLDLGALVEDIVATHGIFVADSGLALRFQAEPGVMIMADADMISQAVTNLLSNAVRYTPEGGTITVVVKDGKPMASVSVEDTGIGLTPEEAKLVFNRFWRSDEGRNRESGGLGIGLSVVKEIVVRHNGKIRVDGQKGVGSCFTIYLPRYEEAPARNR